MRGCAACREYRDALKATRSRLRALIPPIGFGPLAALLRRRRRSKLVAAGCCALLAAGGAGVWVAGQRETIRDVSPAAEGGGKALIGKPIRAGTKLPPNVAMSPSPCASTAPARTDRARQPCPAGHAAHGLTQPRLEDGSSRRPPADVPVLRPRRRGAPRPGRRTAAILYARRRRATPSSSASARSANAASLSAMATISFARGAPSLDIVDVEGLREAAQLAFENDPAGTTAYGTSVGYVPLREWIAEQHGVEVEQVLVTNGSMQADAFLFELLVQAGDAVIVESPTYDRTLLNLRNRGADVRMVDLEPDGISIDGLETVLAAAVHPKLAHIIPNFQNPAGYTLSAEKRKRLLELAVEHDFTIFEDDPYVAIRFEGEPIASMFSQDDAGRVVYASSFSKTVCPGIRVGYLVGPQAVIKAIQTIATNTYISPNMVAQSIVNQFARSGRMDGAIDTVKTALRGAPRRRDHGARARDPGGDLRAPAGRLLHVGRAARGRRRGGAREGRGRARGAVRQGHGLPARGRREHAAAGLLGRDPGADRRGHHAARRGAPQP